MTHVLIAVDRSDEAEGVVRAAHRLFGDRADYSLLNVVDDSTVLWGADALAWGAVYPLAVAVPATLDGSPYALGAERTGSSDEPTAEARGASHARDVATAADLQGAETLGESGRDVAAAVLDAARRQSADVIVVGSHPRGWLSRLVSPSTSAEITRHSDIPVLLVH